MGRKGQMFADKYLQNKNVLMRKTCSRENRLDAPLGTQNRTTFISSYLWWDLQSVVWHGQMRLEGEEKGSIYSLDSVLHLVDA